MSFTLMPAGLEAIVDRAPWKVRVALFAREAFLRPGGDDLAVSEKAGGAVVIESRDPENVRIVHRFY
jgi:hypothetical protein